MEVLEHPIEEVSNHKEGFIAVYGIAKSIHHAEITTSFVEVDFAPNWEVFEGQPFIFWLSIESVGDDLTIVWPHILHIIR